MGESDVHRMRKNERGRERGGMRESVRENDSGN